MTGSVTVLCGGVGAARFLTGLVQVVDPSSVTAVVNTGDDAVVNGLAVSPDLDTVVYTLAGAIDAERGWGLAGETWNAMAALARYQAARPPGSAAGDTWFGLGDRDLATHLYRTTRRAEGAALSTITAEIAAAWGLRLTVVPVTDGPLATRLVLPDGAEIAFQDYFVRFHHDVAVSGVHFAGAGVAPAPGVLDAIATAATVVLAPSNPLVSIGPLRAVTGVEAALAARRARTVAVSPIVGGRALKGPADRMLVELGHEASVVGVARLYRDIAAALVIDPADAHHAAAVRAEGVAPVVVPSVMSTPAAAAALARATLAALPAAPG